MVNPRSNLPAFLADRYSDLMQLCKKHKVQYLYAIGSVLRPEEFGPESDVDLVFALDEDAIPDTQYNPNLWELWDSLEALFGKKVDLIHGPSLKNPYFIEEVHETRQLIYEQDSQEIPLGYRQQY